MRGIVAALLLMPSLLLAGPFEGTQLEVGAANASYSWTGAHYARLSFAFDADRKWTLGMAHVGHQRFSTCPEWGPDACLVQTYRQLFVDVTRFFRWRHIEFGIGPSVVQHLTRVNPAYLNFHLYLGARYKRLSLGVHHYSNAGTSPTGYNMGQDGVVLGWSF